MATEVALADELLECLDDSDLGCSFIHHPLVTFLGYDPSSDEHNRMLNSWLEGKKVALQQAAKDRNWSLVLMLHEKPWRLRALIDYGPAMSDEEYFKELGEIWMQMESLWQHHDDLANLLNPPNRNPELRRLMMTEEEQAVLNGLPDIVMIFRGCGSANESGWSWTLDLKQAEWFAARPCGLFAHGFGGLVLEGRCNRSSIITFLARRQEDEIVIDPSDVMVVNKINIAKDGEGDHDDGGNVDVTTSENEGSG